MKKIDIRPRVGSVLIFSQEIPHMGLSPKNLKYVMRTELMVPTEATKRTECRASEKKRVCGRRN
jgi:hypothetical protein